MIENGRCLESLSNLRVSQGGGKGLRKYCTILVTSRRCGACGIFGQGAVSCKIRRSSAALHATIVVDFDHQKKGKGEKEKRIEDGLEIPSRFFHLQSSAIIRATVSRPDYMDAECDACFAQLLHPGHDQRRGSVRVICLYLTDFPHLPRGM